MAVRVMCFSAQCWCVDFVSEVLKDLKVTLPSLAIALLTQVSDLFQSMKKYTPLSFAWSYPVVLSFYRKLGKKKKSPFSRNNPLS